MRVDFAALIVRHVPGPIEPEEGLAERLGVTGGNPKKLLGLAVEHTSHLNEIKIPQMGNLLRLLEYAGSSLIRLAVAERVHASGPLASAAVASQKIAVAVGDAYAGLIRSLALTATARLGGSLRGQEGQPSEAVLKTLTGQVAGAYALCAGYPELANLVGAELPSPRELPPDADCESALLEYLQSRGIEPRYTLLSQRGPDFGKSFTVEVRGEPGKSVRGAGPTKHEATEDAARRYLTQFAPHFRRMIPRHSFYAGPLQANPVAESRLDLLETAATGLGMGIEAVRVLNTALTHSSYHSQASQLADNTLLANLGSWVLDTMVSFRLVTRRIQTDNPGENAKEFRSAVASIVSKTNTPLQRAFDSLNLGHLLQTGPAVKEINPGMKAEAFQAVLAALFVTRPHPLVLTDVLSEPLLDWLDQAIARDDPKLGLARPQQQSQPQPPPQPATAPLQSVSVPTVALSQTMPPVFLPQAPLPPQNPMAPEPAKPTAVAATAVGGAGKLVKPPIPKDPGQALIRCENCGAHVRQDSMKKHLSWCGSEEVDPTTGLRVPTHRLPFTLLPPGTWDIHQVIEHYRDVARRPGSGWGDRVLDRTRLERIARLRPVRCYVGKESWTGYVVFEFDHTKQVVLECPYEGNATYVLSSEWRRLVGLTKAEIRERYSRHYIRIVHKGDWLHRIREAL